MRILFAGSPAIAVPSLEALAGLCLEDPCFQLGVLTNPDAPRGRRGRPESTDVSVAAGALAGRFAERGMPPIVQLKPEKLDAAAREAVKALEPDLLVSFAYGRIFGPRFLALFPWGGINIHPSLLPKYRGAAPIPAAILGLDRETGVTIQRLAPEMDAGDILAQERFPLTGRETTAGLSETAALKGAAMLTPLVRSLARGSLNGRPQNNGEASYCSLITREDGRIDWSLPALRIDARIRAYTPWPLAWTSHRGETLYILEGEALGETGDEAGGETPEQAGGRTAPAGTVLGTDARRGILVQAGEGTLAIRRLQYRAKKALAWKDFLNGARNFIGALLD
jgi:methionyl-tRNA formyltransferase